MSWPRPFSQEAIQAKIDELTQPAANRAPRALEGAGPEVVVRQLDLIQE